MTSPAPVRPATPADHAAMLALWERSVRATHHFLSDDEVEALIPAVAEAFAAPGLTWWVLASGGDQPVGFLGFAGETVEALFIDPAHIGTGGGRRLLAHAQALAEGRALRVEVNEQNPAARAFYESQGFVVTGRTPTDSAGRPFPLLQMHRPAPAKGNLPDAEPGR